MKLAVLFLLAALGLSPSAIAEPVSSGRILIAGDSTAQTYGLERSPQAGWGQYLSCGLASTAKVINRAMAGRSTRTFIGEGRWDQLMVETRPGDTILIQFAHNDANRAKPERYADPTTTFRDNLLRFVWEARGRQAVPVLVTPVARRNFGPDGKALADFPEWSAVTRAVAAQTGTPLVDLEAASRALLDRVGSAGASGLYLHLAPGAYPGFPKGIDDDTHFSEVGARRMAGMVAAALATLPVPAAHLVTGDRADYDRAAPLGTGACH